MAEKVAELVLSINTDFEMAEFIDRAALLPCIKWPPLVVFEWMSIWPIKEECPRMLNL
jgi:hypothetical protein